jgi:hypothetical protein
MLEAPPGNEIGAAFGCGRHKFALLSRFKAGVAQHGGCVRCFCNADDPAMGCILTVIMIMAGYLGAVSVVTTVKWFWFVIAMALFVPVSLLLQEKLHFAVQSLHSCAWHSWACRPSRWNAPGR